ncbi:hypothetical protein I7I50_02968 [Histoplasma capsulatum G186AR]|uniref:Uncharacterized protein n=1 Tax=Ajellomyces capsulatus TaxID=5037 RepID=A0A8H8D6C8_AJECA|nr:hypothetical protein I7I52_00366 [Histoplasma capsulatum]QSS71940.1 hypothetical protein I7I50_02968 [Histoplasma capsulatum G186AR]
MYRGRQPIAPQTKKYTTHSITPPGLFPRFFPPSPPGRKERKKQNDEKKTKKQKRAHPSINLSANHSISSTGGRAVCAIMRFPDPRLSLSISISISETSPPTVVSSTITAGKWGLLPWCSGS